MRIVLLKNVFAKLNFCIHGRKGGFHGRIGNLHQLPVILSSIVQHEIH